MRKIAILMTIFLLLITFVSAQPPFDPQTAVVGNSLEIAFPKFEYFMMGEEFTLHFHVHNSSGYLMSNDTTACMFHLYNHTNHILQKNLTFDSNFIDYEIDIGTNLITEQGTYTYIVYCLSDIQAGFLSNSFIVNDSGEEIIQKNMLAIAIVFIFLILFFAVLGFKTTQPGVRYLRFLYFAFALIETLILSFIIYANYINVSLSGILRVVFIINLIVGGGIGIISLFFYVIREANITEGLEDKEGENELKWNGDSKDKW